jgi:hypothetical protein
VLVSKPALYVEFVVSLSCLTYNISCVNSQGKAFGTFSTGISCSQRSESPTSNISVPKQRSETPHTTTLHAYR